MKLNWTANLIFLVFIVVSRSAMASSIKVGPAPNGDPIVVSSKIIKNNFSDCKNVSKANRNADGSIFAKCDNAEYLVFTIYNEKDGKNHELAMNCSASKELLGISCFK